MVLRVHDGYSKRLSFAVVDTEKPKWLAERQGSRSASCAFRVLALAARHNSRSCRSDAGAGL